MGTQVYQMLVDGSTAAYIAEDWFRHEYAFDLRLRKAKTKGKVVIELLDPVYAAHILQTYGAQCRIRY